MQKRESSFIDMRRSCDGGTGGAGGSSKRRCAGLSVVLEGGETAVRLKLSRERFSDVQVRVGGELFKAHRVVLAAGSKFLEALFDGQFNDSLAPVVDIHELEPRVFALALDNMYDGKCSVPDSVELEQLLCAASVLQIDALLATVAAEIEEHVTADNCASIMVCADRHNLPELMKKAEAVAREAFVDVASDPAVPASSMLVLLQSDDLHVKTEQEVYETFVQWLKGQAEPLSEGKQLECLAQVRFPLLSQDFVDSTVMTEPAFSTLLSQRLILDQFKDIFFGGETPKERGRKQDSLPALQYQSAAALQPALALFPQAFPTFTHSVHGGSHGPMYTGGAYPFHNGNHLAPFQFL